MNRSTTLLRCTIAAAFAVSWAVSVAAQEPREKFTNLEVLPKDISSEELRALMSTYSRALGVRCVHCHVGEEGKPVRHEDFAKDDKPAKIKAREMMRMTNDLNEKYLANLPSRAEPPVRVQCQTCHHGLTQPRPIQDLLGTAYDQGGMDSTLAAYRTLRENYYGGFAYDFGEMPLADVAGKALALGHAADAESLLALDVEMNPKSSYAKRQHATVALTGAFSVSGESGAAAYRAYRERYGEKVVTEALVNRVAYDLLESGTSDAALAAFSLNVAENPKSANAYDSMGEAYFKIGDRKKAIAAYRKSLELDPANENAVRMLEEMKARPKGKRKEG